MPDFSEMMQIAADADRWLGRTRKTTDMPFGMYGDRVAAYARSDGYTEPGTDGLPVVPIPPHLESGFVLSLGFRGAVVPDFSDLWQSDLDPQVMPESKVMVLLWRAGKQPKWGKPREQWELEIEVWF